LHCFIDNRVFRYVFSGVHQLLIRATENKELVKYDDNIVDIARQTRRKITKK